jgi:competence protein ComEA
VPSVPRLQLAATALVALVVVVLGVRWIQGQAARRGPGPAPAGAQRASGGGGGVRVERARGSPALVHVAGMVRRPGVYRLPADARVADAVRRAGGAAPRGDPDAVNLAARVADGQQVVVPLRVAAATPAGGAGPGTGAASGAGDAAAGGVAAGGAPAAPAPPVSLNTATLEQLDALEGVGPVTAQKILDFRRERGGFRSVDELAQVPGIGPKRLAALRPKVQV